MSCRTEHQGQTLNLRRGGLEKSPRRKKARSGGSSWPLSGARSRVRRMELARRHVRNTHLTAVATSDDQHYRECNGACSAALIISLAGAMRTWSSAGWLPPDCPLKAFPQDPGLSGSVGLGCDSRRDKTKNDPSKNVKVAWYEFSRTPTHFQLQPGGHRQRVERRSATVWPLLSPDCHIGLG
jgi:hypothetical protein